MMEMRRVTILGLMALEAAAKMEFGAMLGSGLRASAQKGGRVENTIEYVELNGDNLPYPGVDVLGLGYSLVHGNPKGDPFTRK